MTCQDFNPKDDTQDQEYPIRALLKDEAVLVPQGMRGCVFNWRRKPDSAPGESGYESEPFLEPGDRYPHNWFVYPSEIVIDPTPEQIAEGRQKAGLPPLSPPATADAKEAEPSKELIRELVQALADTLGTHDEDPEIGCRHCGQALEGPLCKSEVCPGYKARAVLAKAGA